MKKYIYICDLCGKEFETNEMFHDITVTSKEFAQIKQNNQYPIKFPISKKMEICNKCFDSLFIKEDFINGDDL